MTARHAGRRSEAGFSLIELIAAMAIFSLVIGVIGSIFMSLVRTQDTVNDSTSAANTAQLAATAIETGIRNSSNFALTNLGADQFLVARTATSGTTIEWRCQAWYFSAAQQTLRQTSTDGAPIAAPGAAALADWTLLATGISPRNPATVLTKSGGELVVSFDAAIDDAQPVTIEYTVIPPIHDITETSCF